VDGAVTVEVDQEAAVLRVGAMLDPERPERVLKVGEHLLLDPGVEVGRNVRSKGNSL